MTGSCSSFVDCFSLVVLASVRQVSQGLMGKSLGSGGCREGGGGCRGRDQTDSWLHSQPLKSLFSLLGCQVDGGGWVVGWVRGGIHCLDSPDPKRASQFDSEGDSAHASFWRNARSCEGRGLAGFSQSLFCSAEQNLLIGPNKFM